HQHPEAARPRADGPGGDDLHEVRRHRRRTHPLIHHVGPAGRYPPRMPTDRAIHADAAAERLFTSATVITFVRTIASLVLCLLAVREESLTLLVVGLAVYWIGDSLDGLVARWRDCETRTGAVIDMCCDRLNCAGF